MKMAGNNVLTLNRAVYRDSKINSAAAAYKGFADIQISVLGNVCTLIFENCLYGIEETMGEFENYLIDISNAKDNENDTA